MAFAVGAAFAIGFVVLVVVGNQVAEGEPVVGGDEVDAGPGMAGVGLVQIGAAGQAGGELAEGGGFAPPEVPHRIAVTAVPLRPQGGEVAHLVAAFADVPRFGDQLHLGDDGILLDQVEERRQPVDLVELAGQAGGQVEAEPVDVHLGHPVAQRVHDQLQGVRVAHVQAVPGPGGVVVETAVPGYETVVGGVVDAFHRQHWAQVVALGRVVVDDVEDDLDPGLVQRPDHGLELGDLLAPLAGGGVSLCGARKPIELYPQ